MKPFWKYHAIGNDFIIMYEADAGGVDFVQLCDRHKGVGADGVLLYRPHEAYAAEMIIVNSDGSIAEMCGNGLRCFAHWLHSVKLIEELEFTVLTGNGPLVCSLDFDSSVVHAHLGAVGENSFYTATLEYENMHFEATTVNMGNPHLVVVAEKTISEEMARNIAQNINYSQLYSDEANVEVVYRVDNQRHEADTVVHERGVGFTLGCGTGAAAIYSVLAKLTGDDKVWNIAFPGGIVELSGNIQTSIELKGRVVFLYYGELHE